MGKQTEQQRRERVAAYAREALRRKGMSQKALGEATGLDKGTVSAFFTGHRWPTADTRDGIERALDLPAGTLERVYDGTDPDEPSALSGNPVTVEDVEQGGRKYVRIAAQAVGWELTASYTDADDRRAALADIAEAWRHIMGGTGDGGADAGGGP